MDAQTGCVAEDICPPLFSFKECVVKDFLGDCLIVLVAVVGLSWFFGLIPLSLIKQMVMFYTVMGFIAIGGGFALILALQRAMNSTSKKEESED